MVPDKSTVTESIVKKLNVLSFSLAIAATMIFAGIYLSVEKISEQGSISLQSTLFSGQIETGSLGLMVMFLGSILVLAVVLTKGPYRANKNDEQIEIEGNGFKVVCTGLSFRKVREIRELLNELTTKDHNSET